MYYKKGPALITSIHCPLDLDQCANVGDLFQLFLLKLGKEISVQLLKFSVNECRYKQKLVKLIPSRFLQIKAHLLHIVILQ